MQDINLFQLALGLQSPWFVSRSQFDAEQKRLDIHIDFTKGGHFPCPQCARPECKAYDTKDETWRHLNFFQHETLLHARTPRIECPNCGVKKVAVPWARPGCDFTLLFEAFVMVLVKQMPVNAVARLVGEHDTKLWRIVHHYVDEARDKLDLSEVNAVGVDETSSKRGHNYISVFVDIANRRFCSQQKARTRRRWRLSKTTSRHIMVERIRSRKCAVICRRRLSMASRRISRTRRLLLTSSM